MKLRFAPLALLLVPVLCLAELDAYQKTVLATFAEAGTEKPLQAAYEAANAGKATPAQRNIIRNSEIIHEDLKLSACVRPALGEGVSFDDAIAKVVAAGQGAAMIASARGLFSPDEWKAGIAADATTQEQAIAAAIMLVSGSKIEANSPPDYASRALRRRLALNYYLSYATGGKCKPTVQARALVGKQGS